MPACLLRSVVPLLGLSIALAACPRDRPAEPPEVVAEAGTPAYEMQQSLLELWEAQRSYFDDHGRFAEETAILMDEYGFMPVGEATVTIDFVGTEPQWGYRGTAIHYASAERCELLHGQPGATGTPFADRIVCEVDEDAPPPLGEPVGFPENDAPVADPQSEEPDTDQPGQP